MNSLHQIIDQINKDGEISYIHGYDQHTASASITYFMENYKNAICFDIGDIDDLLGMNGIIISTKIILPFETTWFEMTVAFDKINQMSRIGVLAKNVGKTVQFVFFHKIDGRWVLFCNLSADQTSIKNDELHYTAMPNRPETKEFLSSLYLAVVFYCQVIGCSNIKMVDHKPNDFLNRKRIKKGKHPLFTYKTLEIDMPNYRTDKKGFGGTHASPRLHLRRAHIRRYKSGKEILIQEMVVGDKKKGFVHKDYTSKYRNEHETAQ